MYGPGQKAPLKYLSDMWLKLCCVSILPDVNLHMICFSWVKLSVVDLGNMIAAMLDEALLSLSDSEHIESSGFSVDSDNDLEALVDGCSYLNFPFVSFKVFQFNLLFHDFALFRFFILVNVTNVYILINQSLFSIFDAPYIDVC